MRILNIVLLAALWPLAQPQAGEELLVFSGRSDKFVKPVMEAFTQETGIKVTLHAGGSTELLNKIQLEGERSTADIYISNDAGTLQNGADLGLFRAIPEAVARTIPANYRAADNTWLGLSARARVLVVNTQDPAGKGVNSVFDLANPALKGKIALTYSSNESYIAGLSVYMQAKGKATSRKWLADVKQNLDNGVFNKHGEIVKAVADGKKSVGLVNHYYIFRHLEKHPNDPIRILLPDQGEQGMGVAWNVAGVAIARHSKNTVAAEKLLAFLVSEKGQRLFAEVNLEYPTRTGIAAAAEVPAAGSFKVANVPMASLGPLRNEALDLIESVGMP